LPEIPATAVRQAARPCLCLDSVGRERAVLDQFWLWSMQSGLQSAYESIKAFSETDFTEDLKKFDVPTLVLHGEDDQIVPVQDSARKSARLIPGAKEIYYQGAPHGLTAILQDRVNADLLAFLQN
jgi:non-heme chloroperoxidase